MRRTWLVCGLTLALWASAAAAHVYATRTLRALVSEADLVLRARIVSAEGQIRTSVEGPGLGSRPDVEAEVLEVFKGEGRLDAPRVRFVQHGHGVASFAAGDETLLFLIDIERSRELDALGRSGAYAWVSLQEHEDEYPLETATRRPLIAAVRAYVAAEASGPAAARIDTLRRATVGLLTSGDTRLAASALRDCALAPDLPLLVADDLPTLEALLDDPNASMGVRVALLAELERRGLVAGAPRWLALLSADVDPRDRITAIRAAGRSGGAVVRPRLVELLADPDAPVAAAAASALGTPGDVAAVAPLKTALAREQATVRMAAIRGLGRIGTPEALRTLEIAADSHPDPETRRRARAELRKRR